MTAPGHTPSFAPNGLPKAGHGSQRQNAMTNPTIETAKEDRAFLLEAHQFLTAQAYTQEEMDDFMRRLNDHLGIPNDT